MKILEYEYKSSSWVFENVHFDGYINLIVGDSGSGKTRLLNTIFNLGSNVAQMKISSDSEWNLILGIEENKYRWRIKIKSTEDKSYVEKELLFINDKNVIERENEIFKYSNSSLPKFPNNEMSISLLREEEQIKPLYDGFSKILRRKYFEDSEGMNSGIFALNQEFLKRLGKNNDLNEIFKMQLGLNPRLFIISKYFSDIYEKITSSFMEIFNFVKEVRILSSSDFDRVDLPGNAPIFCIKEYNVDKWIRLDEFSSGMQKVLLTITDLYSMPNDSIYLIDEYENSLGIGAIDFLPNLIFEERLNTQLILTSHHPYIINNIPIKYWNIAHRIGSKVIFSSGQELEKRYSVSSQEKYIQLLNDPLYSEGIE